MLTASGVLLSVTFAQPHFRRPFFLASQYDWSMQHATFGETFHYFVYALRRGARTEEDGPDANVANGPIVRSEKESIMHEHMDHEDYLLCIDL